MEIDSIIGKSITVMKDSPSSAGRIVRGRSRACQPAQRGGECMHGAHFVTSIQR